jgi:hypothetical protein
MKNNKISFDNLAIYLALCLVASLLFYVVYEFILAVGNDLLGGGIFGTVFKVLGFGFVGYMIWFRHKRII